MSWLGRYSTVPSSELMLRATVSRLERELAEWKDRAINAETQENEFSAERDDLRAQLAEAKAQLAAAQAEVEHQTGLYQLVSEQRTLLQDSLTKVQAEVAALAKWKEAVTEAAIVSWTLNDANEDNPKQCLADLIAWECKVALEPQVSGEAAKLRDTYKAEVERLRQRINGSPLLALYSTQKCTCDYETGCVPCEACEARDILRAALASSAPAQDMSSVSDG